MRFFIDMTRVWFHQRATFNLRFSLSNQDNERKQVKKPVCKYDPNQMYRVNETLRTKCDNWNSESQISTAFSVKRNGGTADMILVRSNSENAMLRYISTLHATIVDQFVCATYSVCILSIGLSQSILATQHTDIPFLCLDSFHSFRVNAFQMAHWWWEETRENSSGYHLGQETRLKQNWNSDFCCAFPVIAWKLDGVATWFTLCTIPKDVVRQHDTVPMQMSGYERTARPFNLF